MKTLRNRCYTTAIIWMAIFLYAAAYGVSNTVTNHTTHSYSMTQLCDGTNTAYGC